MVLVVKIGQTAPGTKVIGSRTACMAPASSSGVTAACTKENTERILGMGKASSLGQTVADSKANGRKASSMASGSIGLLMASLAVANGLQVSVCAGCLEYELQKRSSEDSTGEVGDLIRRVSKAAVNQITENCCSCTP